MPMVNITDEAMWAIIGARDRLVDSRQDGTKQPDGTWDVPLSDDIVERIQEHRHEGETVSDVIIRVIATQRGTN